MGNVAGFRDHVEKLQAWKEELVENKGQRLAEKTGNKWYNEGKKFTRYLLRLLNCSQPDDFATLENEAGEIIMCESEIDKEMVQFYKNLYDNVEDVQMKVETNDDEFFQYITRADQQLTRRNFGQPSAVAKILPPGLMEYQTP